MYEERADNKQTMHKNTCKIIKSQTYTVAYCSLSMGKSSVDPCNPPGYTIKL